MEQLPGLPSRRYGATACSRAVAARLAATATALLLVGCIHLPHPEVRQAPDNASRMVVFDIDGTLTPRVQSIFSARPDAAATARFYADQGYHLLYLTARTRALQGNLRSYLRRYGFPAGDLVVPQSSADEAAHDMFKAEVLEAYRMRGWEVVAAYGDSSTDFAAYAQAGVPRTRVFALQRVGASACQAGTWVACLPGWSEHLETLLDGVPAPGGGPATPAER